MQRIDRKATELEWEIFSGMCRWVAAQVFRLKVDEFSGGTTSWTKKTPETWMAGLSASQRHGKPKSRNAAVNTSASCSATF
jgi:hypothetical protein